MRRLLLHIFIALLSAFAGTARAQIVDTVCALGGPSNLGVNNPSSGSTYEWNVNGASILSGQGTPTVSIQWPNYQGLYNAQVVEKSADGCVGDTVTAQVYVTLPNSTYITGPEAVCRGQNVQLRAVDQKSNGKFLWSTGDTSDLITFVARKDTLIYRIAFNDHCDNDTVFHYVNVMDAPVIGVSTDAQSDTIGFNTYVNFQYTGNRSESIDWFLNDLWMGSGLSVDIFFTVPGWNEVKVIAETGMCTDTLTHYMWVEDEMKMHIPSAFSPNGDGLNDVWIFEGLGYDRYEVSIFNRWGAMMAHWDQTNPSGWDGTYQGNYVASGAYSYRVKAWSIHNHIKEFTGTITLIR